jgi:amino acid transporter
MKYLEIIRVTLIVIAAVAILFLLIFNGSGHSIPLKTDLTFISVAVVALLLFWSLIQFKKSNTLNLKKNNNIKQSLSCHCHQQLLGQQIKHYL